MAISRRLRFEILKRDGYRCFYCKTDEKKLTVDHVVPKALGGTDDPTNLVAACGTCNNGKASTNPEAPLVAQAREDAMRWQMAWTAAVEEATRDGQQRKKDIAKVKKNYVAAYRGRHGENPILPEGWEASVGRWLDLGAPLTLIDKAIAASVGRRKIPTADRWNYFAGCCWGMIRDLGDRAKQIADASAVDESTEEDSFTAVAIKLWCSTWEDCHSEPAREGDLGEVRDWVHDLLPDTGPAELLQAIEAAAQQQSDDVIGALIKSRRDQWVNDAVSIWYRSWRRTTGYAPTQAEEGPVWEACHTLSAGGALEHALYAAAAFAGSHATNRLHYGLSDEEAGSIGVAKAAQTAEDIWARSWFLSCRVWPCEEKRAAFRDSLWPVGEDGGFTTADVNLAANMAGTYLDTDVKAFLQRHLSSLHVAARPLVSGGA